MQTNRLPYLDSFLQTTCNNYKFLWGCITLKSIN